jgi:hypothetical protein
MTVLRPYRLERELDSAFYHWLAWVPQWSPETSRQRSPQCRQCPRYVDALGLEDLPHGPFHALFCAVDFLLSQQFERELAAQYPQLRGVEGWSVELSDGLVRMIASNGLPLELLLEAADNGVHSGAFPETALLRATEARASLSRNSWSLFENAVARLGLQRAHILQTIAIHVEPKVRRLADDLIAEICDAA